MIIHYQGTSPPHAAAGRTGRHPRRPAPPIADIEPAPCHDVALDGEEAVLVPDDNTDVLRIAAHSRTRVQQLGHELGLVRGKSAQNLARARLACIKRAMV